MIDQVKIGAFLRELRKEKNKTQEEIADDFRVSSRSVSRWENGNTLPDLGMLVELADYYNVDISEIIDGERKSEDMDVEAKESLQRVADYADRKTKQSVLHAITVAVILFALEMVCCGLTIAGGLMVLRSGGELSAGYAVVPMLVTFLLSLALLIAVLRVIRKKK